MASAVATMFTILLVALMLADYLSVTFPAQMQASEFQHILQVQNQFLELQSNIDAQAQDPHLRLLMTTPLSLSGQGVPPLGPPAGSIVGPLNDSWVNTTFGLGLVTGNGTGPTFNTTDMCPLIFGSGNPTGSCNAAGSNNCGATPYYYNFNLSYREFSPTISGSSDCTYLNISGSHDVINLAVGGTHQGLVYVEVQGNYDFLNDNVGSGATYGDTVAIFGQYNTYNGTLSGAGVEVSTILSGFVPSQPTCPWLNGSATDVFRSIAGAANDQQNYTLYNTQGWSSGPTGPCPGGVMPRSGCTGMVGGGSTDSTKWQNVSGTLACAFTIQATSTVPELFSAGLGDTLQNHYTSPVTFDFEQGAVLQGNGQGASMLSGPPLVISRTGSGTYAVALTLVQFVPVNLTTENGIGVIGIETWLVSESSTTFTTPTPGEEGLTGVQFFNITTPYPSAWSGWITQNSVIFPSGSSTTGCHNTWSGLRVCTVSAEMVDSSLTLTQATIGITFQLT